MQRDWCPTLTADSDVQLDRKHLVKLSRNATHGISRLDVAKEYGAIAANTDTSAQKCASAIPGRIFSRPMFSTAIVSSNVNKGFWTVKVLPSPLEGQEDCVESENTTVSLGSGFLFNAVKNGTIVKDVTLPADQLTGFLHLIARTEAKNKDHFFSSNAERITLFASAAQSVSLDELLSTMTNNHWLMRSIKRFVVSNAGASDETKMSTFMEKAVLLKQLSLARCSLRSTAASLFTVLKESSLEQLNVEGNDLGIEDEYLEEIVTALTELLSNNKFLLTVNLAYNNFSSETMRTALDALAASDTKLLPDDLPPEPEEEEETVEELIARSVFIDSDAEDEEDASFSEEEEEDEHEVEEDSDTNANVRHSLRNAAVDTDEEEDEEEDGEDGSGADEEAAEDGEDNGTVEDEEDEEGEAKVDPRIKRMYAKRFARLLREEVKARLAVTRTYLEELAETASEINAIREHRKEEKRTAVEAFCKRRSGWSHVQKLVLRGNRVGDRGAAGVALVLRNEVKLEEEETQTIENTLREKASKLLEGLQSERIATATLETKERRTLLKMAAKELSALQLTAPSYTSPQYFKPTGTGSLEDEVEEEDEEDYDFEAPAVVMTNMDDGDKGAQGASFGDDDADDELNEQAEVEAEWDEDATAWEMSVAPTKSGMNSITYLDLASCEVGSRGLRAIALSLEKNHVLETIILRNNKFGASFKKVVSTEDDDDEEKVFKVEIPNFVSDGFRAFVDMLRVNTTLARIDLGYCQLQPESVRLLAASLTGNQSVRTLCLDGNHINRGVLLLSGDEDQSASCILSLLDAVRVSGVQHLSLSHNDLEDWMWQDEIEALAAASTKLSSLYLNNTGLNAEHLVRWVTALGEIGECTLEVLQLGRNRWDGEQGGSALAALLARCPRLRELCLRESTMLGGAGLAGALITAPSTLVRLDCGSVGAAGPNCASGDATIPPNVLSQLEYLDLSDLELGEDGSELAAWASFLSEHASHALRCLSLWGRKLDMEGNLSVLHRMVEHISSLHFIDFGVLLRFDAKQDVQDELGSIEEMLVARRVASTAVSFLNNGEVPAAVAHV